MSEIGSSRERALDRNGAKLQQKAKDRIAAFAAGLENVSSFSPEKIEDGDPDALLHAYRRAAGSDLKKILARAAAAEAAVKGGE